MKIHSGGCVIIFSCVPSEHTDSLSGKEIPMTAKTYKKGAVPKLDNYPDVLTVEQVSEILNICTKSCYAALRKRKIDHIIIGKAYRVYKASLIKFLENKH